MLALAAPAQPDLLAASDTGVSNSDNITSLNNAAGKELVFSVGGTVVGATVTLYYGSVALGSAVATSGVTQISTAGAAVISDAAISVVARQQLAAETSANSASLAVTIDTIAPAAPSVADLQPSSDTGWSFRDDLTNDSTPTFRSMPSPHFRFFIDGVQTTSAYGIGTTYTTPLLAHGAHEVWQEAVDAAGNVSPPSPPLTVTIDLVAPAAAMMPSLRSTSDSGISDSDDVTAVVRPLLEGAAAEAGYARLVFDGKDYGLTKLEQGGAFALAPLAAPITFTLHWNYSTGDGALHTVAADLNHDNKLDLLTSNPGAFSVSVNLGTGNGLFGLTKSYSRTARPYGLVAADVNEDGNIDAIVTGYPNEVHVMLGTGAGTFSGGGLIGRTSNAGYADDLVAGDVNGDGHIDIIATEGDFTSTIRVLIGNGDGTFRPGVSYAAGAASYNPQLLDVNNDGNADILLAQRDSMAVLLGTGLGTFQPPVMTTGDFPNSRRSAVADFDEDGKVDVMAGEDSVGIVRLYKGNGDGTFTAGETVFTTVNPASCVSADLDGDGHADFVTTTTNRLSIAYGNGDGTFRDFHETSFVNTASDLLAADFDSDGRMDFAAASPGTDGFGVVLGRGGGNLADGTHTAWVSFTDPAGNIAPSSPILSFKVDTSGPAVQSAKAELADRAIAIVFTEPLFGLTLDQLELTHGGSGHLLTAAQTLSSSDNVTWRIGNAGALIGTLGTYGLRVSGIADAGADRAGNSLRAGVVSFDHVNQRPTFDAGGDVTVDEDSGARSSGWASGISAGPTETQVIWFEVATDNDGLFAIVPAIGVDGTLTFTPAANASGEAQVTVVLRDDGGTAGGGVDVGTPYVFTISVDAVADVPALEASNASGFEGVPMLLHVGAALVDADGSEELSIQISGVPAIATLSAGMDLGGGVWALSPGDLAGLTIIAADDCSAELTVMASARESSNADVAIAELAMRLNVQNVAPTMEAISAPTQAVRGQSVTFSGAFADVPADTHEVAWNFGDGSSIAFHSADDPAALAPDKTYAASGTYLVTLTVRDEDGGVKSMSRSIVVSPVLLADDPAMPGKRSLFVGGTGGNDVIEVSPDHGGVKVLINGVKWGGFVPSGRIVVFAQSGNDRVEVAGAITVAAALYGGDGNDTLTGGKGGDTLFGGSGRDVLDGRKGEDLLVED